MSEMSLSDSDLSSLSSAPPTDDEAGAMEVDEPAGIAKYFKKEPESPPPKRAPSPPHEYVLADNPDIAFIVMFRARFSDVFPRSLPHYGPQDLERGVTDLTPGDHIERLLCALLGLVLNRKKDVERNHYQRPLEEAVATHYSQWPKAWEGKNPLHGGHTFATMSPEERLRLLKALILWSLSSSEAVQGKIKESYKQARHEDDLNQPLSVQPWGRDSLKRRYWLIEGQDDTHFRLYRESNPQLKTNTWWSVAGSIPELQAVAAKLDEEKNIHSKKLSERIKNSIPRFESGEEKRKRRDYRLARKAAFSRPEPSFSLYEGRTRGKKLKYTYSDDEDFFSDGLPSTRRSTRNTTAISTPAEPAGPKFTASGRQIRSRAGGIYGETLLSGQREDGTSAQGAEEESGRPQRTRTGRTNGYTGYNSFDEMEEASEGNSSGNEWQGGDDEDDNDNEFEGDDEGEVSGDEEIMNGETPSLVVQLRYGKGKVPSSPNAPGEESSARTADAKPQNGLEEPRSAQLQEPNAAALPEATQESSAILDSKAPITAAPSSTVVEEPTLSQTTERKVEPNGATQEKNGGIHIPVIPQSQSGPVNGANESV